MNEGERVLQQLTDDILTLDSIIDNRKCSNIQNVFGLLDGDHSVVPLVGENPDMGIRSETDNDFIGERQFKRFKHVDVSETKTFVELNKAKATVYKTGSDMRVFDEWTSSINEKRPIEDIPPEELDTILARFYLAVCKKDGTDYEPDTITGFQNSIDRHLKDKGVTFSNKRDGTFSHSNRVLEAKRKHLKAEGKGNKSRKAETLSCEEIQNLQEQGLIGTERRTKTRSGAKSTDIRKVTPKMFEKKDDPYCPVTAYKAYRDHRPEGQFNPESRFYLQDIKSPRSNVWYANTPVGKDKLGKMMNVLAEKGNLEGRKVNHSTRKTFTTALIQAGRALTEIAQLAGWKNVQTVNEYSVPSIEQQAETSDLLSEVMIPNKENALCVADGSTNIESADVMPLEENKENRYEIDYYNYSNRQNSNPYAILCGANITGGVFNINVFSGKRKHTTNNESSQETDN